MNSTQQIQKQKKSYWQKKTDQNLANPNRSSDPSERNDIKNALDPNLGDDLPQVFNVGCCYPILGSSFVNPPEGIPPLAIPEITANQI
jgi:hypothetical protein